MARRRKDDFEIEREFEERVEAKRRRVPVERPSRASAERIPVRENPASQRDRKKTKAPLLLRFLAWCGVILFCFVVGYVGTGYMVTEIFDKPWPLGGNAGDDGTVSPSGEQPAGISETMRLDVQKAAFSIFYPKDGALVSETADVISRTLEDNIQEAVLRILRLGGAGDAVSVLHVFRDVDTVYLDLSSAFVEALNSAGAGAAQLLISGIVRTMNENFSLDKVRFLVDSKIVSTGAPVDLGTVWQIQN